MSTSLRRLGRAWTAARRGEPPPMRETQDFSLVYERGPDLHALRRHDRVEPDLEVADRLVDVHELVQAEQADAERVVVVRLAEDEGPFHSQPFTPMGGRHQLSRIRRAKPVDETDCPESAGTSASASQEIFERHGWNEMDGSGWNPWQDWKTLFW